MSQSSFSKEKMIFSKESKPIKFINNISENKHIVLFYEEPEWAKMIEFEFIKKGLEKGEHCIYWMEDNTQFIEKQMADFRIDIKKYKAKNLLHVYQTPSSYDFYKEGLEGAQKYWKEIMSDVQAPLRVVGRIMREINKKDVIESQIKLEEHFHSIFDTIKGTWLCPYDVNKIESVNRGRWIKRLIDSHDSVIFAPSLDEGIAFDLE